MTDLPATIRCTAKEAVDIYGTCPEENLRGKYTLRVGETGRTKYKGWWHSAPYEAYGRRHSYRSVTLIIRNGGRRRYIAPDTEVILEKIE